MHVTTHHAIMHVTVPILPGQTQFTKTSRVCGVSNLFLVKLRDGKAACYRSYYIEIEE
jgi:hypothetical protein